MTTIPEHHHALTIDVEDYFQVAAFEQQCPVADWPKWPCRVERNIDVALALLDATNTKATFFILGWVAEHFPQIVARIGAAGHEITSHGYYHQRLNLLSQIEFRDDINRSRKLLQDLSGQPVDGYRAPSFSFDESRPWIQDELLAAGYRYSSSINPVPHDLYGYQGAPRTPFRWENGLLEIPVATCEIFGRRVPCAGGGYFRLYPYALSKRLLSRAAAQLQGPTVFYLHPWEIDPDQPRIHNASLKSRFRHYINLRYTQPRLTQLLNDFHWGRVQDLGIVQPATAE